MPKRRATSPSADKKKRGSSTAATPAAKVKRAVETPKQRAALAARMEKHDFTADELRQLAKTNTSFADAVAQLGAPDSAAQQHQPPPPPPADPLAPFIGAESREDVRALLHRLSLEPEFVRAVAESGDLLARLRATAEWGAAATPVVDVEALRRALTPDVVLRLLGTPEFHAVLFPLPSLSAGIVAALEHPGHYALLSVGFFLQAFPLVAPDARDAFLASVARPAAIPQNLPRELVHRDEIHAFADALVHGHRAHPNRFGLAQFYETLQLFAQKSAALPIIGHAAMLFWHPYRTKAEALLRMPVNSRHVWTQRFAQLDRVFDANRLMCVYAAHALQYFFEAVRDFALPVDGFRIMCGYLAARVALPEGASLIYAQWVRAFTDERTGLYDKERAFPAALADADAAAHQLMENVVRHFFTQDLS